MPDLEPIVMKLDRTEVKRQVQEHIDDMNATVEAVRKSEQQQTAIRDEQGRLRDQRGRYLSDQEKARLVASGIEGISLLKQQHSAEEVMLNAKNRLIDQSNSRRTDNAVALLKKELNAHQGLEGQIISVASKINLVGIAYTGLEVASKVVQTIGGFWRDQRKDIEESVLRSISYKEKLLELAAIKDKIGQPDPVYREQLGFRAKTLQGAEAANTFMQGAMNSGAAAIGAGFISDAKGPNGQGSQFDMLTDYIGRFQGATNIDPKALGNLTGSLPMMIGQKGQTAESVFRRFMGIIDTFKVGKQDAGQAVSQFEKNMALIGPGLFKSPEQLASLQSAFSLSSGDEAGTIARQFIEATTGSLTANNSTGMEGSIKAAEYMRQLGVTGKNDPIAIGQAIAADMAKQQATDPNYNPVEYLATKGISGIEKVKALMTFGQLNQAAPGQKSQWQSYYAPRTDPTSAPAMADAVAPLDAFRQTDVAGKRITDLAGDQADASKAGQAAAFMYNARKLAFERLRADPKSGVVGKFEDYNNSYIWEGRLDDEVKKMLYNEAARVGVTPPKDTGWRSYITDDSTVPKWLTEKIGMGGSGGILGGGIDSRMLYTKSERDIAAYDLAQMIQSKPGGTALDNSSLIKAVNDMAVKIVGAIEKQGAKPGQPTPVMPPVAQPGPRQAATR